MAALQELLTDQLRDLYDAEKQLIKALPKMAKAASDAELRDGFTKHLEITQTQLTRLEQAFEALSEKVKGKPCKGMKGLIEEGNEHSGEHQKGVERDCALIGAALRVEHYEVAGYMAARSTAKAGGQKDILGLLGETLKEEEFAGKQLLQIGDRLQKEMASSKADESQAPARNQAKGAAKSASKSDGQPANKSPATKSASKSSSKATGKAAANKSDKGSSDAGSNVTTDHEEIQKWAEARGAKPSRVRGTGRRGDSGLLRLDFPGYSGGESPEEISWEDWFGKFDDEGLALLHQEATAAGQRSNFNKLVSRETAANSGAAAKKSGGKGRRK